MNYFPARALALLCALLLAPPLFCRAQNTPAAPAPPTLAPQLDAPASDAPRLDAGAVAILRRARALVRGWKGLVVEANETTNAGGHSSIRFLYAPPHKARVTVISQAPNGPTATAVSNGKVVSRLLSGSKTYDKFAIATEDDWNAVFGISPALLFSWGILLDRDDGLDARFVEQATTEVDAAYRAQSVEEHGAQGASTDWVNLRVHLVPGEPRLTGLIFGFTQAGLPRDFYLERPIGDALAVVHLDFTRVEPHPNFNAGAFEFTPPQGVALATKPGPILPQLTSQNNAAPVVSPQARALFDRAVAFYASAQTLQLEARGASSERADGKQSLPISLSLRFARPDKASVAGQNDAIKSLWITDGHRVHEWNDLLGDVTDNALQVRGNPTQLRDGLASTDYPVGRYLSGWLFGKHWLQPRELAAFVPGANFFEATALPPLTVNGQEQDRVQIRASYRAENGGAGLNWRHVLYFRPDGALVRVDFSAQKGAVTTRGTVNVISQTRNAVLPASTFVFHKPK